MSYDVYQLYGLPIATFFVNKSRCLQTDCEHVCLFFQLFKNNSGV